MNTIYFLGTCSMCKRILKELNPDCTFLLREIKSDPLTSQEIDLMQKLSGSYASLFSKKALKFKELNLASQILSEDDYRSLILNEYTFLKRPIVIINTQIFIGNSANVISAAYKLIHG
jgi:arsenate reductase (glutaredoxin)